MQNVDIAPTPWRFQFSLRNLLVFSALVAVLSVAISTPTVVWSGIVVLLTFLSLCTAVAAAIYRSAEKRAFALGFALFGGAYLLGLFLAQPKFNQSTGAVEGELPTTRVADWLYGQIHSGSVRTIPSTPMPMGGSGMGGSSGGAPPGMGSPMSGYGGSPGSGFGMASPGPASYQVALYDIRHFQEIIHASVTLLLGFFGGGVARLLYVTNRSNRRAAAS